MNIGRASTDYFAKYWPCVAKHIKCYGQEWLKIEDLDHVGERLAKGELDLWVMCEDDGSPQALGICAWTKGPKFSTYHIVWVGGEQVMKFLDEGLALAEKYACFNGADEVRLEGRAGWAKVLPKFGYVPVVQMKKNVKVLWSR